MKKLYFIIAKIKKHKNGKKHKNLEKHYTLPIAISFQKVKSNTHSLKFLTRVLQLVVKNTVAIQLTMTHSIKNQNTLDYLIQGDLDLHGDEG